MFKNPFSFQGRIRRTEYAVSIIIYAGAFFLAGMVGAVSGAVDSISPVGLVIILPTIWFIIAQGAKRCHDRGNPIFYIFIPFYGLWMLFGDSDFGPNEYGDNPKGLGNEDDESAGE